MNFFQKYTYVTLELTNFSKNRHMLHKSQMHFFKNRPINAFQTKLQRILYVVHPGFGQDMLH